MFVGFNSAVRGMLSSQRALYTINHNVDNMTTRGYSRQSAIQRATHANRVASGFLGTGSEVHSIDRIRDAFVDFKIWYESAPTSEWQTKEKALNEIQHIFGEPDGTSFTKYLNDFYASLENMTKNPGDLSYREPVRENARALVRHINEVGKKLENAQRETAQEIQQRVEQVNSYAKQIAALNRQIYVSEVNGRTANDLRDQREVLVDELSKIVNIQVKELPRAVSSEEEALLASTEARTAMIYDISIGGVSLVHHNQASELRFQPNQPGNPMIVTPKKEKLVWDNGTVADVFSGELKGLVDMYEGDGEENAYRGIPFFRQRLDEFAHGFAEKLNEQHMKGFTLAQEGKPSEAGKKFFEVAQKKGAAQNIRLSDFIEESVAHIAAAGKNNGAPEDNQNLLSLLQQRESKTFFNAVNLPQGTPEDFIKSVVSSMAVDKQQASRFYATQKLLSHNLEQRRSSVSGVNINEEMGDYMQIQKVYRASAQMINTMDQLMEITINRLGMVGR